MKMLRFLMVGVVGAVLMFLAGQALAEPITINWWHAMKGARAWLSVSSSRVSEKP